MYIATNLNLTAANGKGIRLRDCSRAEPCFLPRVFPSPTLRIERRTVPLHTAVLALASADSRARGHTIKTPFARLRSD